MPSISEPSTGSPIRRVPYDILLEIFTHCIPRYPHSFRQPNTMIAPMLLCHICSSWRTIALESPNFWTHLCYRLTIVKDYDTLLASWSFNFTEHNIEFIQWWKKKQGSIPPLLSLETCEFQPDEMRHGPAEDGMSFILEYIASAQYLELDQFFWSQIYQRITAGYHIVFPNLHTLPAKHAWDIECRPFYQVQSLLPNLALSALRRLSISEGIPPDDFDIPNNWSALTLVSLNVFISLNFWFSFIRAVPNLQWGHFKIIFSSVNHTPPPQCTLLQLTTLFVALSGRLARRLTFPISLLFTNLHLPALRTLSLSSPGTNLDSWMYHRAITELYSVLKSTPAITKLILEDNFLSLHTRSTASVLAVTGDVEPIWTHAPQLVHLQFDRPYMTFINGEKVEEILDSFIPNIFSSDSLWLDLQNPACPIRTIMLSDDVSTDDVKDFTMSSIQKHGKNVPNVGFQFTTDSTELVVTQVLNKWGEKF